MALSFRCSGFFFCRPPTSNATSEPLSPSVKPFLPVLCPTGALIFSFLSQLAGLGLWSNVDIGDSLGSEGEGRKKEVWGVGGVLAQLFQAVRLKRYSGSGTFSRASFSSLLLPFFLLGLLGLSKGPHK